jgi:iron complex outermembrane receptor protein
VRGLAPLIAISLLASAAVQAQETSLRDGTIDEIVVTAQRREQSLQDVPIAMTAISADELAAAQVTDLGGLQALVPNLSMTVGDSMNAVAFIRGVGQRENIAFADPGVGIYVDDVYLGRAQGAFLDVLDVERIEVLRGPQGTLYGRNTIGGAIKYVSAAPTEQAHGWSELTAGNFGRVDFKASAGGPLTDALSGKLTVAKLTEDGYTRNLFDGAKIGDRDTTAWRGALRLRATDALMLDFAVDGTRARPDSARPPILMVPGLVSGGVVRSDPYVTDLNFADAADLDTDGAVLTATWQAADNWTFKSVTAYRQLKWLFHFDVDATPLRTFDVFVEDEEQDQTSQELQFAYTSPRLNAVGGLYYFREQDITVQGVFAPDFLGLGFYEIDRNDQRNRSYAAYTQLDFKLLPQLTLTAGLRYTQEEKDFRRIQEFFGDIDFNGAVDVPAPTSVAELVAALGTGIRVTDLDIPDRDPFDNTWSDVSPKLGLSWQATDDALLYATASKGFKSGGFFGRANAAFDASPYDQEELRSYEVGFKSTLLEQRLRLNTAVFYNDYRDMQVTSFAASGGALVATFDNAGRSTLQGAELETIFAVSDAFTLQANVSYLDAQFDEYLIAAPGGGLIDVADQRTLPFTPEWTARLGASYRVVLGSGQLDLGADLSHRSKTYFEINGSEALAQPGYELVNAAAIYTSAGGQWRLMLAGQNLTDEEYRDFGFDLSGSGLGQFAYYGKPRSYSFSVRFSF